MLPKTMFMTHWSESPHDVRPWRRGKVEGPGEGAEAPPAVAQKLRSESALHSFPRCSVQGWTSQDTAPSSTVSASFWPDGAQLGGGPRHLLS